MLAPASGLHAASPATDGEPPDRPEANAAGPADAPVGAVPAAPAPEAEAAQTTRVAAADAGRQAQAPQPTAPEQPPEIFERVRVIGRPDRRPGIPGSVTYVDAERLDRHQYADIHRVLAMVPGVNVQEEEGYGLRPNIGFRGSGSERSSKITVMEDGVLIAPAPYAAPAAYYFPSTERMDGIEVRKGSSSIQQGPFTTGGALNLISATIPARWSGSLRVMRGSDDTINGRARLGGSSGRLGWVVEALRFDTDGFKQLDGGGATGVDRRDYLVKLRLLGPASARRFRALELKLGKTEQLGHETYLGLTAQDFARQPFRRYAASQQDAIETDHEQVQLRYFTRPTRTVDVTATVYRNEFSRNWHKLGKVDDGDGAGFIDIADVLERPELHAGRLAILRGDADSGPDALNVRNNRREYFAEGLHAVVGVRPEDSVHELELGLRLHRDEEDRRQDEDLFAMAGGRMLPTSQGLPCKGCNRVNRAEALAFHVQDTISFGRWTVTPGARFESIDFERVDYGDADLQRGAGALAIRRNGVDVWIPGAGATFAIDRNSRVFAGVHRGFAPPGPGAKPDTRPEESVDYEVGYRHDGPALQAQLVGFYNDYDNLLGADTLAGGGTGEGDLFNGGSARTRGLEAALDCDLGALAGLGFGVPINLAYTYTDAVFRNSFDSEFEAWGQVSAGDRLPYVPRHQVSLGFGAALSRGSLFAQITFQDRMRTRAGQGPIPLGESTDAHTVFDVSADYRVHPRVRLLLQVRNLTDEIYVAARRPAGARPGLPRTALAGFAFAF